MPRNEVNFGYGDSGRCYQLVYAGIYQMTPAREWFIETYCDKTQQALSPKWKDAMTTNLDALLAAEFTAGVEWGVKHMSQRTTWPLSWDAGFPGLKAQALLDRAAAIRNGGGK